MDLINIIDRLQGSIFVTAEDIASQVNQMISEIKENGQTHGRSDAVLGQHVKSGCILEVGIAKMLGGTKNRLVHDSRNPETFAWDVEADGLRFEIKPTRENDTWFNFNIRGAVNSSNEQLTRADLTTYMKYTQYTDFLIAAHYREKMGGWEVQPKWLFDSGNFDKFTRKSNPSSKGTTHYYHIKNGVQNSGCVVLS